MSFRRFLAPLFGAVILAITSLVVPGVASAHPGHAHPRAEVSAAAMPVSAASSIGIAVSAVPAPPAIIADAVRIAAMSTATMSTTVSAAPDHDPPGEGCAGMCCDNTPCGGCVKMAFGKASLPAPLLGACVPASVEARKLSGRLAEGPNEPPRTFI